MNSNLDYYRVQTLKLSNLPAPRRQLQGRQALKLLNYFYAIRPNKTITW
jgi:hypothetical protein